MIIVLALILGATTAARLPFFDHVTKRFILIWKTASSIEMQLLMKSGSISYHLTTQSYLSWFFSSCFALLSRNMLSSNWFRSFWLQSCKAVFEIERSSNLLVRSSIIFSKTKLSLPSIRTIKYCSCSSPKIGDPLIDLPLFSLFFSYNHFLWILAAFFVPTLSSGVWVFKSFSCSSYAHVFLKYEKKNYPLSLDWQLL